MSIEQGVKTVKRLIEGRTRRGEATSLSRLIRNTYAVTEKMSRTGQTENLNYKLKQEDGAVVDMLITRDTIQSWKAAMIDRLIDTEHPADLWNNLKSLFYFARDMRRLKMMRDKRLETANRIEMLNWTEPVNDEK